MFREGFSQEEVLDVLTGMGLPWQEVQLLIERIEAELREAGFESRPTQMEKVLQRNLQGLKRELLARMDTLSQRIELLRLELRRRGSNTKRDFRHRFENLTRT
jgi:hypothetical protein